jgi:hypothetical protein
MEVAFEAAPFGVLGLDEALPRTSDLLGADQELSATVRELGLKSDPHQYLTSLSSQPAEEPFLDEGEG